MSFLKKAAVVAAVAGITLTLAGCQSQQVEHEMAAPAPVLNNQDLYEVGHEGRHYVFDDFAVYQEFLSVGETSYRKVFIGEGPQGKSLVFGLRSEDKKKLEGLAGVSMYKGQMPAADDFYGEMRGEDGRLYVFSRLEDMQAVRNTGEAAFRLTQIGNGPQGQTVVFVLNDSNKKVFPTELVARFKQMNNL
ncbi:hypothetical protein Q4488_16160 [Amphritea sp. 1_MG-2023]|uniref:hypothetical protein n=1 Tax=Amphritea sp. 1_MG-2023 TaxID=3062670 RepID=UPI0026E47678|nr:hypothetical protein [Amphritea sp. 1_MG-2023]MDO6564916.1 hypothetical protein [Amphritea sp. 1_MG-2023]